MKIINYDQFKSSPLRVSIEGLSEPETLMYHKNILGYWEAITTPKSLLHSEIMEFTDLNNLNSESLENYRKAAQALFNSIYNIKEQEKPVSHYIQEVETCGGGSGNTWEVITLKDGKILCLSDECITAWRNREEFDQFMDGKEIDTEDSNSRTLEIYNLKPLKEYPTPDWTEHYSQI